MKKSQNSYSTLNLSPNRSGTSLNLDKGYELIPDFDALANATFNTDNLTVTGVASAVDNQNYRKI